MNIRANFALARQLQPPRMELNPEFFEIDTEANTPVEIPALSNMITSTPGTLTLDIEPDSTDFVRGHCGSLYLY